MAEAYQHRPWVGAGAIVLVVLIATGMYYYQFVVIPAQMVQRVPRQVLVELVAFQFGFSANGTDTKIKPLEVYVGDNVTFIISATFDKDPSFSAHGFLITGLMVNPLTIERGKVVTFNIVPDKPGEFTILCTVFCGGTAAEGHTTMFGTLRVLP